jgi:PAS domain S-box-containing protein
VFSKKVQSYINQIMVTEEEIQGNAKGDLHPALYESSGLPNHPGSNKEMICSSCLTSLGEAALSDHLPSASCLLQCCCLYEITEQKQARELAKALEQLQAETAKRQAVEAQLRQKTSECAAILQVLPDLYFRLDIDGSILDYKPGKAENACIPTGDCQGKSLRECLPTVIGDRFQQAITQVLETQSSVSFEYTLPLPQGKNNFEARLLPLPDQQIIVLVRDTSDKVQAALIESDTKFRTIIENSNNIIFALTVEGIFSYVSPNWTEIFGHEIAEVEGKSFIPFIHPDDVPICADYFQKIATTTEKQDAIEYRIKHKNGT